MTQDEMIQFLRANLRIEVNKTSEYTGGMNGSGSLYSDSHTIQLVLDDEVISEVSL